MAAANGKTKEDTPIKMEDIPVNGSIFPGDATRIKRRSRHRARRRSAIGWALDKALKLSIWYILYLVTFACPATEQDITLSTSSICKPYLKARSYLLPHIQPTYDQYVAPYAHKAQPYVEQLQAKVYEPGLSIYNQHGAPVVAQVQKLGQEQWDKTLKPQIDGARQQAGKQFDAVLGPHVKKVQDAIQPQVDSLRSSVNDFWELEIEPVYRHAAPYADKLYKQGQDFAVKTALPQAQYASSAAYAFWIRQIWPKVRILYGENVEPQLMRITERLGRYQDKDKLEADVKLAEVSATVSSASTAISSTGSSVVASSSLPPKPSVDTQDQFRADLESWKLACATAAKEGADHLNDRINEITEHQISSSAEGVGSARVTQLEQTVEGSLSSVKARILGIVAGMPGEDAEERDYEDAHESLTIAIRNAGQSVKKYATAVREWRQQYNVDTTELVNQALTSTLETIDNIRELRLTDIGRTYASSSLPHKEWAKYNELKKATQDWRDDVKLVVERSDAVKNAEEAGKKIEGHGMSIAEEAAKELGRLKEVGKWKIESQDASDDFDSKTLPPVRKVKQVLEHPVEAISEAIFGDETGSETSTTNEESSATVDGDSEIVTETSENTARDDEDPVTELSEVIIGETSTSDAESTTPAVKQISDPTADNMMYGAEAVTSTLESVGEEGISTASSLLSEASSSVSAVWGGVAAQAVPSSSGPILDDLLDDISDSAASVSSYYSEQVAKVSDALAGTGTPSPQGAVESVSSVASQKYTEALAQASSHWEAVKSRVSVEISGTPKPIHEQMYASAESAYSDAVSRASSRLGEALGTIPTSSAYSLYESISSVASSRLSQALKTASAQYQSAKIAVGAEPTPVHQAYLASAQQAYYHGVGVAHDQYSSFVDAAGRVIGATSTGYLEAASSSYASAIAIASSNLAALVSSGSSIVGATTQPAHESVLSGLSAQYSSVVAAASSQLAQASAQASAAIYGEPQHPVQSAASAVSSNIADLSNQASANWDAIIAKASSQIYGTPVPFTASVYSQATSIGAQATSAAAVQYEAVVSLFSELVSGREPAYTESVSSRLSSAYFTGMPGIASAASSYASEAYESASSVISSVFSPPPTVEAVLGSVTEQLNSLVDAASVQVYGSSTGQIESATSAAASAYSHGSSRVSEAIYGSQTGYAEAATSSFLDISESASKIISEAIFGTRTGSIESATKAGANTYSSLSSVASEQVAAAASAVSSAIYGPEQGALESAQSRIAEAVASAQLRIQDFAQGAGAAAESVAIDAQSAAASVTQRIKDEL